MKLAYYKGRIGKVAFAFSASLLLSLNISANKPESAKAETSETKSIEISQEELKSVRGFVVDEFGEPMVGVEVKAIGSKKNTITNTEGKYTLMAQESDILKFSQIGMTDKEEKITSSRIVNVSLIID